MSAAVQLALDLPSFDGECQRWRDHEQSWLPVHQGGFDRRRHKVKPIDEADARAFVCTHHYSGSFPAARLTYGLIRDDDEGDGKHLAGVAVLGVPMRKQVLTKPFPTLEPYIQSLELSRFVLLDEVESNGETHTIGEVFKLAAGEGIRGVVAFSDPQPRHTIHGGLVMPGHRGHIYRSAKGDTGRYTGRATKRTLTLLPDGRVFSDRRRSKIIGAERGADGAVQDLVTLGAPPPPTWIRAMSKPDRKAWLAFALQAVGARKVRHRGNHRFVWTIGDRGARRRIPIALDPQPYPTHIDPAPPVDLALAA